jgi:hypothetical protein
MKAILLSFPFIYFSESGLFKGLRPEKIKNSSQVQLAPRVVLERPQTPAFLLAKPAARVQRLILILLMGNRSTWILFLQISASLELRPGREPTRLAESSGCG